MLIASMLTLSATVSASEVTYKNLVTDDTTIEEDFKLLGMDINEYYIPKTYNYQKWYVVAMSESYNADRTIQTYFYLYNPTTHEHLPELTFRYTLNGIQKTFKTDDFLEVDSTRNLYKVKGFIYEYCVKAEINITNIHHYYEEALLEDGDWYTESYNSESNFKATNQHSLANQDVTMELNYNSTLIIEEYNVVRVVVEQEDNFANNWSSWWSHEKEYLNLFFYNFNFPDRVEYDTVEYAKFKYDYVYYDSFELTSFGIYKNENKRVTEIKPYYPDTKTLRVNDKSLEMNFDVFYLGNRYADGQFKFDGYEITGDLSYFDCDCSILLDSTYMFGNTWTSLSAPTKYKDIEVDSTWRGAVLYEYTMLDDVEMLELHYRNDGILYECQVVSAPVDEDDFGNANVGSDTSDDDEESLLDKFIKWFKDNFPKSLIIIVVIAVAIIALCAFAPHIVIGVFKGLFSIVFYIVSLPFRLIGAIFNRGKD